MPHREPSVQISRRKYLHLPVAALDRAASYSKPRDTEDTSEIRLDQLRRAQDTSYCPMYQVGLTVRWRSSSVALPLLLPPNNTARHPDPHPPSVLAHAESFTPSPPPQTTHLITATEDRRPI